MVPQPAWSDEIEAAFDARLGKARNKAQYLNIQAYTLLTTHPQDAALRELHQFDGRHSVT